MMDVNKIKFINAENDDNFRCEISKFGGSSFVPLKNVEHIANFIIEKAKKGIKQVVLCSAPTGLTDQLKDMANEIAELPISSALDGLVMSSDLIGTQLLYHSLLAKGFKVHLRGGLENGILTNTNTGGSNVLSVNSKDMAESLSQVDICLLPGGQGHSEDGELRWLGKNSSDLSCVLLAVASKLNHCSIHSDVESIYSADPNVIKNAMPYQEIDYNSVITAAKLGAKVLHPNSVIFAKNNNVEIHCKLNKIPFATGTVIGDYDPATIVVTDRRSQLITLSQKDLDTVTTNLEVMNITYFTSRQINILAENQILIPMAYVNYEALLTLKFPQIIAQVEPVCAIHVVKGDCVMESRFVDSKNLQAVAASLHQSIIESELREVANV